MDWSTAREEVHTLIRSVQTPYKWALMAEQPVVALPPARFIPLAILDHRRHDRRMPERLRRLERLESSASGLTLLTEGAGGSRATCWWAQMACTRAFDRAC